MLVEGWQLVALAFSTVCNQAGGRFMRVSTQIIANLLAFLKFANIFPKLGAASGSEPQKSLQRGERDYSELGERSP